MTPEDYKITFYADADIKNWLDELDTDERSKIINHLLREEIQRKKGLTVEERISLLEQQQLEMLQNFTYEMVPNDTTTPTKKRTQPSFDNFTEQLVRVVMLAQEEARRLVHNFVGTEHLLFALLQEHTGFAAQTLNSEGVTLNIVRAETLRIVNRGVGCVVVDIPFTPRSKRILARAGDESKKLDHSKVGTAHLLLALIGDSESVAVRVLENLGVDLERLRNKIVKLAVDPADTEVL